MADTTADYVAAAWQAAPAFGLEPTEIAVLSHSENVVFDLTMPAGNHLVMRLHRAGYNTLAELESEVQWVSALGAAGIPVPAAVPTVDGGHYTAVEVAGQSHYVGVVEWVDGSPLGGPTQAGEGNLIPQYHRIGALSARIRQHHAAWDRPASFERRRWDADGFVGDTPLWGRFWEVEALTAEQRTVFTDARNLLREQLAALPTDDEHFGLIHSDLHLGNLMANGDQLTVIDFDDAGFGWFAHELAVSLHPVLDAPWYGEARAALLAGYRTVHPLSAEEESWIDMFLTMRCLMIIGWLDARREVPIYQYFGEIAEESESVVRQYLANQTIDLAPKSI